MEKRLLTEREVSQLVGRSVPTLRNDRAQGKGIPFIRVERLVRYDPEDLAQYLAAHRVEPR